MLKYIEKSIHEELEQKWNIKEDTEKTKGLMLWHESLGVATWTIRCRGIEINVQKDEFSKESMSRHDTLVLIFILHVIYIYI